jgi:hypothetical protein
VPPLVTDIDLSMDDRLLYVACWGTGEMRQYDVTDPRKPKLAGSVRIAGITRRTPHPSGKVYAGGPQMVEISRDGKPVDWTNSLYSTWDNQFYPTGVPGAEVMANANASGGLELARDYWVSFPDEYRAHQIRLEAAIARRTRSAALVQIAVTSKNAFLLRHGDFKPQAPHSRPPAQLGPERPDVPVRTVPSGCGAVVPMRAIAIAAFLNPLKPSITAMRCFTPRWSCSIRLFRYLIAFSICLGEAAAGRPYRF